MFTHSLISHPQALQSLGQAFAKKLLTVNTCDVHEQVEDLFDVTFCYFPITFKAPKEDPFGVSPAALKEGLKEVLATTPFFGSLALPALLKTLSSSSLNAKKDALATLLAAIPVYNADDLASHLGDLVNSIAEEIYHPIDDDVQACAFEATEALFSRLFSITPTSKQVESELHKAVGAATNQLLDKESKEPKHAGRLIHALARSGVNACHHILLNALSPILQAYKEADLVTQRKLLLEVVAGLVNIYATLPSTPTDPLLSYQSELLVCFEQVLGMASEYNELRKTAIEGLSSLIVLPSIGAEEQEFYTMKITQVYLEDEDEVVKQAALAGMWQLAQVEKLAFNVILPQVFGCLEPLGKCPPQATSRAESALKSIIKLSSHQPLFQTAIDRVIGLFDSACQRQNDARSLIKLLVCIQNIIEEHIVRLHKLPNLLTSVVYKLWEISLFSSLGAMEYHSVGSTPELLETISHITVLALRWVESDSQAHFLKIAHQLFFEVEKPTIFTASPVALEDFFPFSPSSLHSSMCILYLAALAPCRREAAMPCSSTEEFLTSLVELCFESQSSSLRKACHTILALVVNKYSNDVSLMDFVSRKIKTDIKFVAFDYSASQSRRSAALEMIIWTARGLVTLGNDTGFQLLDFMFMLLEDDVLGNQAALGIHLILCDDEWFFCKANHASIRLLFKQRVFSVLFPIITALFNQASSRDEVKQNCLIALAALLKNSPQKILIREGKQLLPLLLSCLKQASESIQEAAINSLFTLMAEGGLSESALRLSFFHHDKPTLLETLLYLATETDGPKRRFGIQVRVGALKCLALFPSLTVSPSIHSVDDLEPTAICRLVNQRLSIALDDPKRLVRAEAVKCRHKWLTVTISSK
ncbi:hypothetical protein DSO57_1015099 [Entomophthora muscae]|uniref:Uncharacterized protein n=1 Tax=Entomophthora muscae TaxID=34485 RepID=A0ACC2U4L2_9FUNG|nr:hypothetical protein DSO57_1015099 [Entomophthora muscae]